MIGVCRSRRTGKRPYLGFLAGEGAVSNSCPVREKAQTAIDADSTLDNFDILHSSHIGSRLDKREEQFKESIHQETDRLLARFATMRPVLDDDVRLALRRTLSSTGLDESWFDKIEELAAASE